MHAGFEALIRADLRRLPAHAPPAGAWQAIAARLDAEAATRAAAGSMLPPPAGAVHWRIDAIAAMLIGALAIGALWLQQGIVGRSDVAGDMAAPLAAVQAVATGDDVQRLQARSQRLEQALQRLPPRPAVERVATSATIDALQARIQLLDGELNAGDEAADSRAQERALWNERVRLMDSLVNVRYAEAVRAGLHTADYRSNDR